MADIFISYRREDSAGFTGRLVDTLSNRFTESALFRDIDDIEVGSDFVDAIDEAVGACGVLLAVIGPRWLEAQNPRGERRLDDAQDFVRLEIAAALNRGTKVIPVLVNNAQMPAAEALPESIRDLARRHAIELTDSRWRFDVDRLCSAIEKLPDIGQPRAVPPLVVPPAKSTKGMVKVTVGALAGMLLVAFLVWLLVGRETVDDPQAPEQAASEKNNVPYVPEPRREMAGNNKSDYPDQDKAQPVVKLTNRNNKEVKRTIKIETTTQTQAIKEPGVATGAGSSPSASLFQGRWASAQGVTYDISQTKTVIEVVGKSGYQVVIIAEGEVRGRVANISWKDNDGGYGNGELKVSPDGKSIQGWSHNQASDQHNALVLSRAN